MEKSESVLNLENLKKGGISFTGKQSSGCNYNLLSGLSRLFHPINETGTITTIHCNDAKAIYDKLANELKTVES